MGLFSGKDVTNVGTQVQRVLEDKSIPDSVATGVTKNLYNDDDQMVEYVMEEFTKSIGLRAERVRRFGQNKYLYGVPQSTLKTSAAGRDATIDAIKAVAGAGMSLSYYHFGAYNNLHFGWKTLVDSYAYNSSTNTLSVNGKTVYLKDMQVVVTDATLNELANGSMDQWGTAPNAGYVPQDITAGLLGLAKAPTPFAVDPAASGDYVRVDYCWEEDTTTQVANALSATGTTPVTLKTVKSASFTIPMTGLDVDADYHQAKYSINGREYYWTYRHGAGTNPTVDAVFDTAYAAGGSFFPIVYFRYNKMSAESDKTAQWYTDSVKMCNYIGMDFASLTSSIHENPDIAEIEQAMMMMAVPANTTNKLEQRYLFDFFSGIYDEMVPVQGATSTSLDFMNIHLDLGDSVQETSIVIQDARFKMALAYKTIVRKLVTGNIGKVGSYTSGDNSTDTVIAVPKIGGGTMDWTTPQEMHWYRHQLTDSVYEEIQVHGLKMTYWIFENYTTTGDGDSKILLIPIDRAITQHYTLAEKEELYARSMQYVFNSRVVTHLKWYQTGVFQVLMLIVAVVITIYSYGMSWQAIVAALGTITAEQVLIYLVVKIIEYYVMKLIVKFFIKELGTRFAFLAAVMLVVAACYQIYTNGGLTWLPTAPQLLQVATSLTTGIQQQVKTDTNSLINERNDFQKAMDAKEKLIDEANALLDTGLRVDPLVIFGESPAEFYQRTVHSGNIAVVGLDAVTNYVDLALQLPKLSDSLGELHG